MQAIILRLRILLAVMLVIMVAGTAGFAVIENRSAVEAAYFTIVTVATVGYGDIHPATQSGRIFTIILIVTGVGTFLGVIANISSQGCFPLHGGACLPGGREKHSPVGP